MRYILIFCFFTIATCKAQLVWTNMTVEEMKVVMIKNYPKFKLVGGKGSKVLIGQDSLNEYEYWNMSLNDTIFQNRIFYGKLGRVAACVYTNDISLLADEINTLNKHYTMDSPPLKKYDFSWTTAYFTIGINIDKSDYKSYTYYEIALRE